MMNPFTPGSTVSRSVNSGSQSVALPSPRGDQVRVMPLTGSVVVFIKFGTAAVAAAVTDMPVLPGLGEVFTIPPGATHVAAICAASTSTVYFTAGDGQ